MMGGNLVKQFKSVKFFQLGLIIILDVIFFGIVYFNPSLKNTVFSNSSITILFFIMWGLCILYLGFTTYDLQKIMKLEFFQYELNKEAYVDTLTGIPNRTSLDRISHDFLEDEALSHLACAVFQVSNLNAINAKHGHETGNSLLRNFSNMLGAVGDSYGFVSRNGGNEFIALFENCNEERMKIFLSDMTECIHLYNNNKDNIPLSIVFAYAINETVHATIATDLICTAYKNLNKTLHP